MRRYISFIFTALFAVSAFATDPCVKALINVAGPSDFAPRETKRQLREVKQLKLGTYNTFNLLRSADGSYRKSVDKQEGLARPILKNDLDIIVVEEVNDMAEMRDFARMRLKDLYEPILAESNDSRGIKVGYFVKKDLPFRLEVTTSKDVEAVYPVTGEVRKVYSRDLPGLRVWATDQNGNEEPLITLFGTHFKSKRDKPGDKESRILRRLQNEVSSLIVEKEMELYPKSIVLVAGDFNGDVPSEAEFEPLRNILLDVFDFQIPPLSKTDRITHSFHPNGGTTKYSQLDAFLIDPKGEQYVQKSFVHRYVDSNGNEIPLPKTWDERNENPSDHFPVILEFDFLKLLKDREVLPQGVSWIHRQLPLAPITPEIYPEPLVA